MMSAMGHAGSTIFFSAFEPSGDALAAALIARLRERGTDAPIYALGGPLMEAAGAILLERTTDRAVMLGGIASEVAAHRKRLRRTADWLKKQKLALHIPTDSPAANWSICQQVRKLQPNAKIMHLAAPQLWAWAPWRIHKLRRLTDRVLCLLPFEPGWFESRGVSATFVGHPLYGEIKMEPATDLGGGNPKLVLLPGSRAVEIAKNWATMRQAYDRLKQKFPDMRGVVAASDAARAKQLGDDLQVVVGRAQEVLEWADLALVVSGTATLQCARQGVPMVALFNVNRWVWQSVGRWLVRTRTFTLPNLIGESLGLGHIVPELVPHFGDGDAVADAMEPLMVEGLAREQQRQAFDRLAQVFGEVNFADAAADEVEKLMGGDMDH